MNIFIATILFLASVANAAKLHKNRDLQKEMMIRIEKLVRRKNLGQAPLSRSHQALARNDTDNVYYDDDYYDDFYYYQGFIPDGIVSRQCAATTAVSFYSPKIYSEDTIVEIENGIIDQSPDFLLCSNVSCDTFQSNCEAYGGQFVTANLTYYTESCEVEFRDIHYPFCLGWDCDETEVQDFFNYIALTPQCDDDDQNVPIQTYGGPIIDAYPNDTNAVCYADMFNLFFFTEVYGNDIVEFDFDNIDKSFCEANNGIVLNTTMEDTTKQNGNDLCTSLTDVPLCYSDSCSASEAKSMLEYYFNDMNVLSEEEGCESLDVTIATIAPTISPSISIAPTISSTAPTISSTAPTISSTAPTISSPFDKKNSKTSKSKKSSKSKKAKSKKSSKDSKDSKSGKS